MQENLSEKTMTGTVIYFSLSHYFCGNYLGPF